MSNDSRVHDLLGAYRGQLLSFVDNVPCAIMVLDQELALNGRKWLQWDEMVSYPARHGQGGVDGDADSSFEFCSALQVGTATGNYGCLLRTKIKILPSL